MTKTIKALIPPQKEKAPCTVMFTDGTKAQYWPTQKFGAELKEGVTAECVTEEKQNGQYTNTILIQWGEKVAKSFQGRIITPEERRSLAFQSCLKAAADVFHGSKDPEETAKAATAFMRLHDHTVGGTK